MVDASDDKVAELKQILTGAEEPLAKRFRALFTLKAVHDDRAVEAIAAAFADDSALLKHEVAYVLGQMQLESAVPILTEVLGNASENPMVRHEAGEALGAIGTEECMAAVASYVNDEEVVVAETCQLAVSRIEHERAVAAGEVVEEDLTDNPYASVDPAPPAKKATVAELRTTLLDNTLPLFERYRALFALRNDGCDEAVLAICDAFDDNSALFRHELAYVLGQMQSPVSVPALTVVLENAEEQDMVRHEAAEALGSIASTDVPALLEKYKTDAQDVVRESCVVALDMAEYEANEEAFQYADGLVVGEAAA